VYPSLCISPSIGTTVSSSIGFSSAQQGTAVLARVEKLKEEPARLTACRNQIACRVEGVVAQYDGMSVG
jgi:hypothetical protein